ncbi:MAG TPA: hypothetical protein VLD36_05940 [Burkholderiales bacterium]|nr:hypothetical protein [Burkholderiales bacterium]
MRQTIPENLPDYDRARIIERPDGFHWQSKDNGREYGPFATLVEAVAGMQAAKETGYEPGVSLEEAKPDSVRRYGLRGSSSSPESTRQPVGQGASSDMSMSRRASSTVSNGSMAATDYPGAAYTSAHPRMSGAANVLAAGMDPRYARDPEGY